MSSSVAICAICLKDARPILEDLQSISACGHVFHEPCLQRWMEYCPAGRDPTCPLCKRSISCRAHDVHSLYFQAAGSDSTEPQVSPPRNLQTAVEDSKHVNCSSAFCKLESKLDAAMKSSTVMNCVYEQFKELESQVAMNLQRAEKAEAATLVARSELALCKEDLREELMYCSLELGMAQETIVAIEKRVERVLASHEQAQFRFGVFGLYRLCVKLERI